MPVGIKVQEMLWPELVGSRGSRLVAVAFRLRLVCRERQTDDIFIIGKVKGEPGAN